MMDPSDASVSETCRKEAAALLKSDCLLEAAASYTKSLAFAPAASRGLCYAGRSAVLLAAGHFLQSVRDAERALASGYPELLRFKLHLRMATCWRALQQTPKAQQAFLQALALIEASSQLSEEKKKCMSEEAVREFEAPLPQGSKALWVNYERPPPLAHGPAACNERMSAAVRVHDDQQFGRHLVAERDINTGVLFLAPLFCDFFKS
jgi:tetratricopeptide (TPR) repeat protein